MVKGEKESSSPHFQSSFSYREEVIKCSSFMHFIVDPTPKNFQSVTSGQSFSL